MFEELTQLIRNGTPALPKPVGTPSLSEGMTILPLTDLFHKSASDVSVESYMAEGVCGDARLEHTV